MFGVWKSIYPVSRRLHGFRTPCRREVAPLLSGKEELTGRLRRRGDGCLGMVSALAARQSGMAIQAGGDFCALVDQDGSFDPSPAPGASQGEQEWWEDGPLPVVDKWTFASHLAVTLTTRDDHVELRQVKPFPVLSYAGSVRLGAKRSRAVGVSVGVWLSKAAKRQTNARESDER